MPRSGAEITPIDIPFSGNALVEKTVPLLERALFEPTVALREGEGIGGRRNALEAHLALPGVKRIDESGVQALIGFQHILAEQRLRLILHVPESIGAKLAPFGIDFQLITQKTKH